MDETGGVGMIVLIVILAVAAGAGAFFFFSANEKKKRLAKKSEFESKKRRGKNGQQESSDERREREAKERAEEAERLTREALGENYRKEPEKEETQSPLTFPIVENEVPSREADSSTTEDDENTIALVGKDDLTPKDASEESYLAKESLKKEESTPQAKTPEKEEEGRGFVLLVDDSKVVRIKTSKFLLAKGFKVETAVDGQEALEKIEAGLAPDVVLTDAEMPRLDGFVLTEKLKSDSLTKDLAVVLMTGHASLHAEADKMGMLDGFVTKPFNEDKLERLLANICANAWAKRKM